MAVAGALHFEDEGRDVMGVFWEAIAAPSWKNVQLKGSRVAVLKQSRPCITITPDAAHSCSGIVLVNFMEIIFEMVESSDLCTTTLGL